MFSEIWAFFKSEQLQSIIALLSLATTIYFTKTLADNDNKMEKRADQEKEERKNREIIEWCINEWKKCGTSQGQMQTTGYHLFYRFSVDKTNLIVDSFEIYKNQNQNLTLPTNPEKINDVSVAVKYESNS